MFNLNYFLILVSVLIICTQIIYATPFLITNVYLLTSDHFMPQIFYICHRTEYVCFYGIRLSELNIASPVIDGVIFLSLRCVLEKWHRIKQQSVLGKHL